ncbi:hypothetical protein FB567DRAFT_60016 [Paraphoma chrysanthemicola]|uniref:RING-type domain-containing protein n=1 Tax=Paraphoma chrysanthemicola TaxID=798071 RepID=A0A8K0VZ59_9PLEO|nr:hypothetical protein FB567DRAFT_60016 [Paraphoma chrysanthemicola]
MPATGVVAQTSSPHDVHPLLRHPKPITRDSAKAQRMLGLIADSEEKLTGLHRERSRTTKWLERPLYSHLDVSDIESEKEDDHKQDQRPSAIGDDVKNVDLLERWNKPARPTSFSSEDAAQVSVEPKTKLDTSFNKRRPEPLTNLRPVSYQSQHHLSPQWTVSPATMTPTVQRRPVSMQPNSPSMQRSSFSSASSSSSLQVVHPQTWPALGLHRQPNCRTERPVSYQPPSSMSEQDNYMSLSSSDVTDRRPRPTSFATFQNRERRHIASSRGLRNNSYPNYSRPISGIASPRVIPGEAIEDDAIYNRFDDGEVGPPSPSSPIRAALNGFEMGSSKKQDQKKPKHRWSAIPHTLKKLAVRRTSGAAQERPPPEINIDSIRRMNLTEQNLHWYEGEANPPMSTQSTPGLKTLPTPTYSPLEHPALESTLPPPFAPWADTPPSPALSQEKRRSSDVSLSPTRKRTQSRLSIENVVTPSRPDSMHSRNSSFGFPSPVRHIPPPQMAANIPPSPRPVSRRATPCLERTCIICKVTKQPSAFASRRIAANCWHEPATCFQCLQAHIEKCVMAVGWEQCTCPECGERITYEDMGALADDDNTLIRWDS